MKEIDYKNKKKLYKKNDLELLISNNGYNRYQYTNLFVCFILMGLDGMIMTLSSSMIIPLYNYYKMTKIMLAISSAIVFLGISIGCVCLKSLVNKYGRISTLNLGLVLILISHLGYILTTNSIVFSIYRFISGIGNGIQLSLILTITCDKLPFNSKGFAVSSAWMGFASFQVINLILMYYLMPNYESNKVPLVLFLLFVLTLIACVISFIYNKDSPEHLIILGKIKEAKQVINSMLYPEIISQNEFEKITANVLKFNERIEKLESKSYESLQIENNNNNYNEEYLLDVNNNINDVKDQEKIRHNLFDKHNNNYNNKKEDVKLLIKYKELDNKEVDEVNYKERLINNSNNINTKDPLVSNSSTLNDLNVIFSGRYKLSSYLISIICITSAIIFYGPLLITSITIIAINKTSNNSQPISDIILGNINIAFALIISNPIGGALSELKFLGRKHTILICYIPCLIANILIIIYPSIYEACQTIILLFGNISYNLFIIYFTELYPSKLRDSAVSYFFSLNRFGGCISQLVFLYLFNLGLFIPYYVLTAIISVTIICVFMLPYNTVN